MFKIFHVLLLSCLIIVSPKTKLPDSKRAGDVRTKIWPGLQKELKNKGFDENSPIYICVFKDQDVLEVWKRAGNKYKLFKTYQICYYSGNLGTKTKMGDNKSPEGFYTIEPK